MHDDSNDMSEDMSNDELGHEPVGDEEMGLDGPATAVGHELAALPVPDAPPLGTIVARGRALKHRHRAQLAGVGATVAIATAVAVPLVAGVAASGGKGPTASGAVHANLADFTVDSSHNGMVTVTWRKGVTVFDASGLRAALAKAGVPAVVRVGAFCTAVASPMSLSPEPGKVAAANAVLRVAKGSNAHFQKSGSSIVISRAALPARSRVTFDYVNDKMAVSVQPVAGRLRCSSNVPVKCAGKAPVAMPGPGGSAPASTVPASTLPFSTVPASTLAASELPPASVPVTTVPATTVPTSTVPASTLPATTLANGGSGASVKAPPFRWCVVQVVTAAPGRTSVNIKSPATSTTGSSSTSTLPLSTSATTTLPNATE